MGTWPSLIVRSKALGLVWLEMNPAIDPVPLRQAVIEGVRIPSGI